jgi:TPR repeat protein
MSLKRRAVPTLAPNQSSPVSGRADRQVATGVEEQDTAAGLDPPVLAKAKAGDAASDYLVTTANQKGDIVPRDFLQAAEWYRKAADQGNVGA